MTSEEWATVVPGRTVLQHARIGRMRVIRITWDDGGIPALIELLAHDQSAREKMPENFLNPELSLFLQTKDAQRLLSLSPGPSS